MKLGISMWSYFHAYQAGKIDIPGFIHEAKKIGADGVELLDVFYRERDIAHERARALTALEETGLSCGVFSVAQNFAKMLPEDRELELEKIKFGVDEAVHFGAATVRVFAGNPTQGVTFDQARSWIIDGLCKAARYADENGVRLALENHGLLAGRSDQVKSIIDEVRVLTGNHALGANPDTGNFLLVGEQSDTAVRNLASCAYMVHFKDFAHAPANWTGHAYAAEDGTQFVGTAIGEGEVNLQACVAALKEANFDGWLNIEYEAEEDQIGRAHV